MFPPSAFDITAGVDLDGFEDLTPAQRRVIYTLLARVAERSYRRGFQQGVTLGGKGASSLPANLHDWRYGCGTDASPWADSRKVETSLDRLETENRNLRTVLGECPKRPTANAIEGHNYVTYLIGLSAMLHKAAADGTAGEKADAWQRLRAFGVELHSISQAKMVEVYDDAIDQHGDAAVRGVLPVWDGIGGEYLS